MRARFQSDIKAGLSQLKRAIGSDRTARTGRCAQTFTSGERAAATTGNQMREPATSSGRTHGELVAEYITALQVKKRTITSPNSAGFAVRIADGTNRHRWILSWLPDMVLTHDQALSAMVIDEILLARELDSATMLQIMSDLAADLTMPLHQILGRLSSGKKNAERYGIADWQRRVDSYRSTSPTGIITTVGAAARRRSA
ncbi:hypothetical protein AB0C34_28070 [Nocardia sp. NPDC049220]|uniref:hypothetical protein n=1 Tax=Nocardia sp. NPDC049220 TaxID=3155273 RepID=UPI0033E4C86B